MRHSYTTEAASAYKGRQRVMEACIALIKATEECMPAEAPKHPPGTPEAMVAATAAFWATRETMQNAILAFVQAGLVANLLAEAIDAGTVFMRGPDAKDARPDEVPARDGDGDTPASDPSKRDARDGTAPRLHR